LNETVHGLSCHFDIVGSGVSLPDYLMAFHCIPDLLHRIMKSRADDIRGKLAEVEVEGDAHATWRTAQKLLHLKAPVYQNDAECASLSLASSLLTK